MGKGKRVALLVGCTYPGTPFSLLGCINDANSMKNLLLTRFDFKPNDITLLTDQKGNRSELQPTGANIKDKLNHLAACCTDPNDLFVFFFSGHGGRGNFSDSSKDEDEEVICPTDWNLITCHDFRNIVNKMKNATFVLVADSCNSGGLIDKEELQICNLNFDTFSVGAKKPTTKTGVLKRITPDQLRQVLGTNQNTRISDQMVTLFGKNASLAFLPRTKCFPMKEIAKDKGILFSACRCDESAYDLSTGFGPYLEPHGAFTVALLDFLHRHMNTLRNKEVVDGVGKLLFVHNYDQHPCLYCTKENVLATFLFQQPMVMFGFAAPMHQPDLLSSYAGAIRVPKLEQPN